MIITGGLYKGRKIKTVKSNEVRPTSSKIRESILNILQGGGILSKPLPDIIMLDLFAGSGIMGLEFASRGVKEVIFVEKSPKVSRILRENLSNFDFKYQLLNFDVLIALDKLKNLKFDIIFADPPYASEIIHPALKKILENNLLNEDGMIIIEHSSARNIEEIIKDSGFKILKSRHYGDTAITIIISEI